MSASLLLRLFVKNHDRLNRPEVRLACGVLSGIIGIAVNILLFGIKIIVGIASGSIAIAADAVNNLADAGSSVITVVGFKLSSRPADSDHPFGHGRGRFSEREYHRIFFTGQTAHQQPDASDNHRNTVF